MLASARLRGSRGACGRNEIRRADQGRLEARHGRRKEAKSRRVVRQRASETLKGLLKPESPRGASNGSKENLRETC